MRPPLPFIRDARGLDYAFCGLIVSLHSVGNLFSSFTAGLLPVAIGRKKSILFFNLFFALSYVLIIFGNHNWCIAMAFFLTGVARGATSNFCNTAINSSSNSGKSMDDQWTGRSMSLCRGIFIPDSSDTVYGNRGIRLDHSVLFYACDGNFKLDSIRNDPEWKMAGWNEKRKKTAVSDSSQNRCFICALQHYFFYLCAAGGCHRMDDHIF